MSVLDAVERGCTVCEEEQCDFTVGFGGSPDEKGETTLDAMIMDGTTMNMGAVCGLRRIKNAIGVARKVLDNTEHSILAGELATEFAKMVGFKEESLSTVDSTRKWKQWKQYKCQPNSWIASIALYNVKPDPRQSCGPYSPSEDYHENAIKATPDVGENNHDTITMIAIDEDQRTAVGTSSNGKNHKIPGEAEDARKKEE
ncbi:hypothetical protein LSTR_LSTR011783 [Laodelphax striatellus]|uniref:N(4)-(Beta-N-acetylglucosaminyl)-L-asparaginase n=1 Tax=Laodelphax striatellus TaxID=195883 RepID=A0A482XL08_LAOST|nr:hypothetical protein LSTR_LSTR011783 [Laodelphax striatellus]